MLLKQSFDHLWLATNCIPDGFNLMHFIWRSGVSFDYYSLQTLAITVLRAVGHAKMAMLSTTKCALALIQSYQNEKSHSEFRIWMHKEIQMSLTDVVFT